MTQKKKYKVLQDISLASVQTSGIPQETRLLFGMYAENEGIQVDGLMYSNRVSLEDNIAIKEFKGVKKQAYNFLNSSIFLRAAADDIAENFFNGGRYFRRFKTLTTSYFKTYKMAKVPSASQFDAIWRLYFSKTLPAKFRDLLREQRYYFSNLSLPTIMDRARLPINIRPKLKTEGYDFLVTPDSRPVSVSAGTHHIIRYYDPIPILHIDTFYMSPKIHFRLVERSADSAYYVCDSLPVERQLVEIFPQLKGRTTTIPCLLPKDVSPVADTLDPKQIVRTRISTACVDEDERHKQRIREKCLAGLETTDNMKFILSLATIEPRKNFTAVVRAWERLRVKHGEDLKLIIVGSRGWKYENTLKAFRPHYEQGNLFHLESLPFVEIQALYKKAECFVFPSLAEGFGYPPLEALQCGTPSVVSNIDVLKWVMKDAALYADPYSVQDIANNIEQLVFAKGKKKTIDGIMKRAPEVLKLYAPDTISAQWDQLFDDLKTKGRPTSQLDG